MEKFNSKLREERNYSHDCTMTFGSSYFVQTVFIAFNHVIIYHLPWETLDLLQGYAGSRGRVFFVPAARTYGLFIFPHKICQQIRDDRPLQGRRDCIKLIRKDKGGQRTESQRFAPCRTLK